VVRVGIHSFIVTLGVGTLVQGLAVGIAGTTTIGGLPESLTSVFQDQWFQISRSFYYVLVIGIAFYLVLGRMPLGRSLFFTGNARSAASLAGVRTERLRALSLVSAAVVACIAGIMLAGQTGAASPTFAAPYLLPAYAAAFLGATAFVPGRFNICGSLWAVYLLAVGTTGFQLLGLANWVIDFFDGAVLVLAVALSRIIDKRPTPSRLEPV
jgi:ribose transport system permease protein